MVEWIHVLELAGSGWERASTLCFVTPVVEDTRDALSADSSPRMIPYSFIDTHLKTDTMPHTTQDTRARGDGSRNVTNESFGPISRLKLALAACQIMSDFSSCALISYSSWLTTLFPEFSVIFRVLHLLIIRNFLMQPD